MSIASKIQLAQDKVLEIFQLLEKQNIDVANKNSLTELKQAVQEYIDTHGGSQQNFTVIDYVESNGNQYIDTQIPITNSMCVDLEFLVTNWQEGDSLGGNYIDGQEFNILKNNEGILKSNVSLGELYNLGNADNNRHLLLYNYVGKKISYDNIQKTYVRNIEGEINTPNLLLLTNSIIGQRVSGRFYKCKITSNITGEVLRYFIPVLDENNIVSLYDLVSQQFFYSLGSEDFSY